MKSFRFSQYTGESYEFLDRIHPPEGNSSMDGRISFKRAWTPDLKRPVLLETTIYPILELLRSVNSERKTNSFHGFSGVRACAYIICFKLALRISSTLIPAFTFTACTAFVASVLEYPNAISA